MARNMYGATPDAFTWAAGRVAPGAELEVWDARTGGTQITDLTDVDDVACTTVTSDASGSVVFYGPDGERGVLWMESGLGDRLAARPTDPAPIAVSGVRDDPEAALAALLTALDTAGLIDDQTTETA